MSLKVTVDGFIPRPVRRIFRPTVLEFEARFDEPRIGYQAFAVANLEHRSREIALRQRRDLIYQPGAPPQESSNKDDQR